MKYTIVAKVVEVKYFNIDVEAEDAVSAMNTATSKIQDVATLLTTSDFIASIVSVNKAA